MRFIVLLTIFLSSTALAEKAPLPFVYVSDSDDVLMFSCAMTSVATPQKLKPTTFKLRFVYDRKNETAYVLGSKEAAPLEIHRGNKSISFIEFVPSGTINTITITSENRAVYSRNIALPHRFSPSQYYGSCEARS